jgi:zinc/manganese transport system substrate-binding protein
VPSKRNVLTLLIASFTWLTACGVATAQALAEKLQVVATFSILADFVREVGRDRIALTTLVGPDGDAHVYSPAPGDSRKLAEAKLIVVNGLGLEGWMARLIKSSGAKGTVVEAARGVKPRKSDDAHAHGGFDPHAWQDVANARIYVANIRDALSRADPAGREAYEANAAAYLVVLEGLEREVRAAVAAIPAERRRVITTHDAFGYFKAAYGLDFVAPQGVSTDAEASAKDVARIIRQIKAERIPAVFLENVADPRLMDRIAKETGARTGARLYSDALSGPDGPAGTYIAMVRHNIRAFSDALSR